MEPELHAEGVRKILDLLPALFVLTDRDGSIRWANKAFRDLFPASCDGPAVVNIGTVLPYPTDLKEVIREVHDSGCARPGSIILAMDSRKVQRTLRADIMPGEGMGGAGAVILSATDITELAELEKVKKIAYEQIERNIEQLATLGDQIRNPLTVIAGLSDLLDDRGIADKIHVQAREIDAAITRIDKGWIASEKVRSVLRRYYDAGISGTHQLVARAIHEEYLAQQRAAGKTAEDNPSIRPWNELNNRVVESNLRQADDIWKKLGRIRCGIGIMVDNRSPPFRFTEDEIEELAVCEHERWMQEKVSQGWREGRVFDPEQKLHDCLVPWQLLPEDQREKDRNTIRTMPAILAKVRLKIVRLDS
ncbi:MAG TPA: RyR domain-containing protein [Methanoregulaceae archaeon]|nr:RyR domain-containing protein [Methanoregulaceae archaeon]HPD75175.1 RyR domain-containing protein [Methanoregulaceae archaeon]HRY75498.1 RyR domain-containing protein [Methanoregulaceae archaeon]